MKRQKRDRLERAHSRVSGRHFRAFRVNIVPDQSSVDARSQWLGGWR
ncbi:ribosome modulation factor, partial [Serratia marcescens]|nr:ribosome modulation factor [Serratia marcescens]